ncbi:MAG: hypothetical protein H6737_18710 [Alphaproteobacteria bacterium]|nr:hypothetical protein [Alphaproteobacteria bacterium]
MWFSWLVGCSGGLAADMQGVDGVRVVVPADAEAWSDADVSRIEDALTRANPESTARAAGWNGSGDATTMTVRLELRSPPAETVRLVAEQRVRFMRDGIAADEGLDWTLTATPDGRAVDLVSVLRSPEGALASIGRYYAGPDGTVVELDCSCALTEGCPTRLDEPWTFCALDSPPADAIHVDAIIAAPSEPLAETVAGVLSLEIPPNLRRVEDRYGRDRTDVFRVARLDASSTTMYQSRLNPLLVMGLALRDRTWCQRTPCQMEDVESDVVTQMFGITTPLTGAPEIRKETVVHQGIERRVLTMHFPMTTFSKSVLWEEDGAIREVSCTAIGAAVGLVAETCALAD